MNGIHVIKLNVMLSTNIHGHIPAITYYLTLTK